MSYNIEMREFKITHDMYEDGKGKVSLTPTEEMDDLEDFGSVTYAVLPEENDVPTVLIDWVQIDAEFRGHGLAGSLLAEVASTYHPANIVTTIAEEQTLLEILPEAAAMSGMTMRLDSPTQLKRFPLVRAFERGNIEVKHVDVKPLNEPNAQFPFTARLYGRTNGR